MSGKKISSTHLCSEVGVLCGKGVADEFLLNKWYESDLGQPGIEVANGRLTQVGLKEDENERERIPDRVET